MKYYKLMIAALVLAAVCCLCGCNPTVTVDIDCIGLAEDEMAFVLIYPAEGDELRKNIDEDTAGSAVFRDDKDGFVLAEQIPDVDFVDRLDRKIRLGFGDRFTRMDFCKKYKTIRIAVCDDRWQIKSISEDFDVFCKDKHAIVTEARYDSATGEFQREKLERRDYKGTSSAEIYGVLLMVSIPLDIVLLTVMLVFNARKRPVKELTLWLTFGLLSLPNIALSVFYIAENTVPYLNINDDRFDGGDIITLIVMNFAWLLAWGGLIIYQVNKGRYTYEVKEE